MLKNTLDFKYPSISREQADLESQIQSLQQGIDVLKEQAQVINIMIRLVIIVFFLK